jgi:hypothetical protein
VFDISSDEVNWISASQVTLIQIASQLDLWPSEWRGKFLSSPSYEFLDEDVSRRSREPILQNDDLGLAP